MRQSPRQTGSNGLSIDRGNIRKISHLRAITCQTTISTFEGEKCQPRDGVETQSGILGAVGEDQQNQQCLYHTPYALLHLPPSYHTTLG